MEKPLVPPLSLNHTVPALFSRQKKPQGYAILFFLLTIPTGGLSLIPVNSGFSFWGIKVVQLLSFLSMGLLHLYGMGKRQSTSPLLFNYQLYYSLFLSLAIGIFLSLLYFFTDPNLFRMSFASSGAFLLPFMVKQAWDFYVHIPPKQYEVWYPHKGKPDNRVSIFLNSIRVHFKLTRTYYDFEQVLFTTMTPLQINLGRLFDQFIAGQNKQQNTNHIECADENDTAYGWELYIESFGGYKRNYLNPEKSVWDNGIRKDTIITVKRVKADIKKLPYDISDKAKERVSATKNKTL